MLTGTDASLVTVNSDYERHGHWWSIKQGDAAMRLHVSQESSPVDLRTWHAALSPTSTTSRGRCAQAQGVQSS